MQKRTNERPVATTEPMGIVISRGPEPVEPPAAWAFVWGAVELDEATRLALHA